MKTILNKPVRFEEMFRMLINASKIKEEKVIYDSSKVTPINSHRQTRVHTTKNNSRSKTKHNRPTKSGINTPKANQ